MALLSRKRLILAKIETTYGTDSAPAGTDAVLVRALDVTPLEADVVSRDLIRPYYGNSDQLLANTRVRCSFEVELAGSGTAGDVAGVYGTTAEGRPDDLAANRASWRKVLLVPTAWSMSSAV